MGRAIMAWLAFRLMLLELVVLLSCLPEGAAVIADARTKNAIIERNEPRFVIK